MKNAVNGYVILNDVKYFADDRSQNYLIFQPICNTFRIPTNNTEIIIAWKFKGLSDNRIRLPTAAGNSLAPKLGWFNNSKIEEELPNGD